MGIPRQTFPHPHAQQNSTVGNLLPVLDGENEMAFPGSTPGSRENKPVLPGSARPCPDPDGTTPGLQFVIIIISNNVMINVNIDDNNDSNKITVLCSR